MLRFTKAKKLFPLLPSAGKIFFLVVFSLTATVQRIDPVQADRPMGEIHSPALTEYFQVGGVARGSMEAVGDPSTGDTIAVNCRRGLPDVFSISRKRRARSSGRHHLDNTPIRSPPVDCRS